MYGDMLYVNKVAWIVQKGNLELYEKIEKMISIIKKSRLVFYGHLERMNPERLGD